METFQFGWSTPGTRQILERLDSVNQRLDLIAASLAILTTKANEMSGTLDVSIAQLVADNAALKTELDGAPAAIATLVATAIAKLADSGVSEEQLQSLSDLHTALSGDKAELDAALAGTAPAAPTATPTSSSAPVAPVLPVPAPIGATPVPVPSPAPTPAPDPAPEPDAPTAPTVMGADGTSTVPAPASSSTVPSIPATPITP